jgi:hypothetical protein
MRSISLWEPWATLVALGRKRIETRGRKTDVRGPILIQAADRWTGEQHDTMLRLQAHGLVDLELSRLWAGRFEKTRGKILAMVTLGWCVPTKAVLSQCSEEEQQYGNYAAGRYAWGFLEHVRFSHMIPNKGKQGFWHVPTYLYQWRNTEARRRLYGRECLVLCRLSMNSCVVVFVDDGLAACVSRNSLRMRTSLRRRETS